MMSGITPRAALGLALGVLFAACRVSAENQGAQEGLLLRKARFGDAFLSRYEAPYLNYGWIDYETYREGVPIFKRYDAFGNYLTEGYEVFRIEEFRAADEGQNGSVLLKGRFYQNWLRHLIVADDAYGGWSTRITVGDAISTTFSALTLDMARFNGVRWDEASPNNRFTLVLSRLSDPVKLDLKNQLGPGGKRIETDNGLYLMGGHWESRVGDFLVLGASYVNLHRFDATKGYRTNTRKGLAPPFTTPTQIVIRIQDDSPEDGTGGALVFSVKGRARIRRDGEEHFEEVEATRVDMSPGVTQEGRHLEASGRYVDGNGLSRPVYVEYSFPVPDSTAGMSFAAVVANDYRILTRQDHDFQNLSRNRTEAVSTEFRTIRRADGNITDGTNKAAVVFDQGMLAGMEIIGLDARVKGAGFHVEGELARSTNNFQYAARDGSRSDFGEYAGYLRIDRKMGQLGLNLEGFHIGPQYTGYATESIARQNAEASPAAAAGGVKLNIDDPRTMGTTFFFNRPRQDPISTDATEGGNKTNNPIFALVDDNDDMDQWPDDWVQDWDVANREIKYLESDAGILPFFDFDADGFPDNNRNRNQLADSDEPFLMYFTDPKEFYFGDDNNNNFVLDIWEDDDQPNYPYSKDQEGIHASASIDLLPGLELHLGRYDIQQVAGGGRNQVTYGRLKYRGTPRAGWRIRLDHESKDVVDDIADPYFEYRVEERSDGRLIPSQFFVADPLNARDSFVNRGLLDVAYGPGRFGNLSAKFRYELNRQHATGDQQRDTVKFYGLLIKGDHTHRLGRLVLMPRFKVQYRRQERDRVALPMVEDLIVAPLLRIDYELTGRSQVRFGAQGMPLLPDRRLDFRERDNDSRRRSYVLMWYNLSDYQGYKVGTEAGAEYDAVDYDVRGRSDESYVRYFVRMIAGVGSSR